VEQSQSLSKLLIAGVAPLLLATAVQAQIDVVFKIDESGSMSDEIDDVKNNVVTIFNALPAGSHVGLVGYGSNLHVTSQDRPHVHTPLTDDQVACQAAANSLLASGGVEEGFRAVYESATDTIADSPPRFIGPLGFTGAPYCNILITDETPDQPSPDGGGRTRQEAIDAMNNVGGIFFGILPTEFFEDAQPLADATGGQLFDLGQFSQDATPVINAVLAACVETAIPVKIDIKPTSCPNPFKLTEQGVISAAILGTENFDVTRVKPDSVRLEGACAALRWNIEDVATPYEDGFSDPPLEDECTTAGADGRPDLTVQFDSQCVAMTQGEVTEPAVRLWTITGTFVNDNGVDVEFEVKDVVRVMP
jgi:hypothetical protein